MSPAYAGFASVVGNVLGVAFLKDMPAAYRLARLDEWASAVRAQPGNTLASAACFALGLLALGAWARELGRVAGSPLAVFGGTVTAVTAALNAAASLLVSVPALEGGACGAACGGEGFTFLHAALTVDALFNLGLGVGLLCVGLAWRSAPRLRLLALAAGLASVPVAGQAVWDGAAAVLYFAAPLWLTFILLTSITWLRPHVAAQR